MKIGDLAKAIGCDVQTVRHYEKEGLLPQPARSGSGYRLYRAEDAERLRFIRRCRELGMSLPEIRTLLGYRDDPDAACGEVNAIVDRHLAGIDERIAALIDLRSVLAGLRTQCAEARIARDCGILNALKRVAQP